MGGYISPHHIFLIEGRAKSEKKVVTNTIWKRKTEDNNYSEMDVSAITK